MDREAAKQAVAGFIEGRPLAANQIEFVNLISKDAVDDLVGVLDAIESTAVAA